MDDERLGLVSDETCVSSGSAGVRVWEAPRV